MNTEPTTLPPAVVTAAERLAAALLAAEPIVTYHHAQTEFEADPQVRDLLKRFAQLQATLRQRQTEGVISETDLTTLRLLQRQVQSNTVIMTYLQAEQAALGFLPGVNQEISQLLGLNFASLAGPGGCC